MPADYSQPYVYCLVDGYYLYEAWPLIDHFEENGKIQFTQGYDNENGQYIEEDVECANPEEYYEWLREDLIRRQGKSEAEADITVCKTQLVYESYMNGNYEILPEGSIDLVNDFSIWDNGNGYIVTIEINGSMIIIQSKQ